MSSLADRRIWVIDDGIPVNDLPAGSENIVLGRRPVDETALRFLVDAKVDWPSNEPVRSLISKLLETKAHLAAFPHPNAALQHLRTGATPPEVIVFDLKYEFPKRWTKPEVAQALEAILGGYYTIVQVYTAETQAEAVREVKDVRDRYRSRMVEPMTKSQVTPEMLAEALSDILDRSLSAYLGKPVRRTASKAIENALVHVGDLPLDRAVHILSPSGEGDVEPIELEMLEILATEMQEHLTGDDGLRKVIGEAYERVGLEQPAADILDAVVGQVHDAFCGSDRLREVLRNAADRNQGRGRTGSEEGGDPNAAEAASRFFAFRLYDKLSCPEVRTGDIIKYNGEHLAMVITPPCDVARFWKKTRGCLTLVAVHKMATSKERIRCGGNRKLRAEGSITATEPILLPLLPGTEADGLVFCHEVISWCTVAPEGDADGGTLSYEGLRKALDGSSLGVGDVEWLCRVSEPFLGGILDKIRATLFRRGVPNWPTEERDRLRTAAAPVAE